MKIQIDIDESLLREAMEATKLTSPQEVTRAALEKLVRLERQREALRSIEGSITYDPVTETWTAKDQFEPTP
jgi:Arc/MetJ family transcription regulator